MESTRDRSTINKLCSHAGPAARQGGGDAAYLSDIFEHFSLASKGSESVLVNCETVNNGTHLISDNRDCENFPGSAKNGDFYR